MSAITPAPLHAITARSHGAVAVHTRALHVDSTRLALHTTSVLSGIADALDDELEEIHSITSQAHAPHALARLAQLSNLVDDTTTTVEAITDHLHEFADTITSTTTPTRRTRATLRVLRRSVSFQLARVNAWNWPDTETTDHTPYWVTGNAAGYTTLHTTTTDALEILRGLLTLALDALDTAAETARPSRLVLVLTASRHHSATAPLNAPPPPPQHLPARALTTLLVAAPAAPPL